MPNGSQGMQLTAIKAALDSLSYHALGIWLSGIGIMREDWATAVAGCSEGLEVTG